jgi:MFS superfamily sulfate permease-like transporter
MKQLSERSDSNKATWRQDLLASLVVFLVALPLCMGIALASGAPVAAGLVTGIVGGILVGTFAGSPLQVSGPAAGLTVICGEIIRQHGMPAFGLAVLFAGVFQLTAGIFRLGQWFRAVSPAVIHGMLSGIGILILCGQLHVLVDERPRDTALRSIAALPASLQKGLAIPDAEPESVRSAHIELLRRANAINERQRKLGSSISRLLKRMKAPDADEDLQIAPVAPSIRSQSELLQPLLAEQQIIQQELATMTKAAAVSSLVTMGGSKSKDFQSLLVIANAKVSTAIDGLKSDDRNLVMSSQKEVAAAIEAATESLKSHDWAGKIGLLSVIVIFVWQFTAKGSMKLIPAPLLAIIITTAVTAFFQIPILHIELPNNLLSGLTLPSMQTLADAPVRVLLGSGLVIAIVASAETLLCATAVDQMHRGPRTRYDKELSAQGLGNIVCGCLGVLPMTGVIVRSAANVQAGGRTRLSAILHGVWLLLFSVALVPVLRLIPTAALAGILVYTGIRLIDIKGLVHLWKENRVEGGIFLITMIVIVAEDLLTGVVAGIVLSAIKLLARFSQLDVHVKKDDETDAHRTTMKLVGAATFIRLPKLASRLEKVDAGAHLHVDVSEMDYIDRACMELLQNWSRQHAATGGTLTIDWESLNSKFQTSRPRNAAVTLETGNTAK